MSKSASDARLLSQSLLTAWVMLDEQLELPALVAKQIDELRPNAPSTLPVRKYFEAVCYETMLLSGLAWDRTRRQSISATDRSSYLEWLVGQEFGLPGMHEAQAPIADPAYWRWANLKYANSGTEDKTRWSACLASAKQAALADCQKLIRPLSPAATSLKPLSPSQVRTALAEACARHQLGCETVRLDSGGFGFRLPLAIDPYHIECRIRDVEVLHRRIIPFEFEVASTAREQRLRVAGDRAVWPGSAEYRNVCTGANAVDGVCEVLVLFLRAVVAASVQMLNQPT